MYDSLEKGKVIMKSNQYPPDFYEPIIFDTWSSIVSPEIRYEDKDERAEKLVLESIIKYNSLRIIE